MRLCGQAEPSLECDGGGRLRSINSKLKIGNRYFQRYFCYSDECVDTKPQNKPCGVERCAEEGGEEDGNEEEESSYYGACYSGRTTVEVHSSTKSQVPPAHCQLFQQPCIDDIMMNTCIRYAELGS